MTAHNPKDIARADAFDSYYPCSTTNAYSSKRCHSKYNGFLSQDLGSLMILPVAGPTQPEAMCFFQDISIKHLNGIRPCESWRKTLMLFAQAVPPVRHAATALAMVHRKYLDRHSNGRVYQPYFLEDQLLDKTSLFHYNRAIQLLLKPEIGDSAEIIAVTLLVSYLFTCFDYLVGNDTQAVKHLRGGVELSRDIDNATLYNHTYHDTQPSGVHEIICQVTKQIRRLDMQTGMFLIDWTPANIEEPFVSHLATFDSTFCSVDQAADYLQILVAQVMRLRNTEQRMFQADTTPPFPSSLKNIVLGQLETWSSLFKTLLQRGGPSEPDLETNRLTSHLRLQHTVAWILLSCCGLGRELDYDDFLPQFQKCISLASEVAAAHQRYSGYSGSSRSSFTPEIGIIPILYIIGAKCRHPVVRREVVSILQRQSLQEASWDSIVIARVVERIVEVEEGAAGEGQTVPSMEQIPAWQRIEELSYTHIPKGHSAARLDIMYTLCGRDGIHTESLVIERI